MAINLGKRTGKPQSGLICSIKTSCKLNYKLAIKKAFQNYENNYKDEILNHFLNKKSPQFWKCWSNKMSNNVTKTVHIDGNNENSYVANSFANHFKTVSSCVVDEQDKLEFETVLNEIPESLMCSNVLNSINVELVDACIRELKKGKASGGNGHFPSWTFPHGIFTNIFPHKYFHHKHFSLDISPSRFMEDILMCKV